MNPPRIKTTLAYLAVATLFAGTAMGAVTTAGQAYGAKANISADNLLELNINPLVEVSGTAPAAYNEGNQVLGTAASTADFADFNTSVITTNVTTDVDGAEGSKYTFAISTVDGLDFGLAGVSPGSSVLSITADSITSSSYISGQEGSFNPQAFSEIQGLAITVFGQSLEITAQALNTPNFLLFQGSGITIILNEQIQTGDLRFNPSVEVNSIRVNFNDVAGADLVNGDLIIGHSYVGINPIPEPASAALLIPGCLMFLRRRRK